MCYGLFNTIRPDDAKDWRIATMDPSRPVESGRTDHAKHVMFAHILATLGKHPVITDADMEFPENWRDPVASKGSPLGHQSSGRTVCLHSCAVCPEVQGVGIGKTAMKAYLQLINESGMADRVALICQPVSSEYTVLPIDLYPANNSSTRFNSTRVLVSGILARAQRLWLAKAGMPW